MRKIICTTDDLRVKDKGHALYRIPDDFGGYGKLLLQYLRPHKPSKPHLHNHIEVYRVLHGELVLTVEGKQYRLKAGDEATVASNVKHSVRNDGRTECVTLIYLDTDEL